MIRSIQKCMQKIKQKSNFLKIGIFFFFGFFFFDVQSAFACQGAVAQWGGMLSGQCKSTCLSAPKEESVSLSLVGCAENEFCCIPNPNLNRSCAVSASGSTRNGTCKASFDCSGSFEGLAIAPCSTTGLVCCVARSAGGRACSGSYMSGRPATGTCVSGATSCSGGRIFVGTCSGGICCAVPEGGTGGGGTGGGGTGGGGTGGGGTGGGGTGGGGTVGNRTLPPTSGGSSGNGTTCSGDGMIAIGPTFIPGGACLPRTRISVIVVNLLQWLLYIFGFLAVLAFVISGVMYLTSGGNDKMIDRAKEYMVWSIIGVVVALSGLIIMSAINAWLQNSPYYF